MRLPLFDRRGMTLIETIITLAISLMSLAAFLYLALGNRAHKSSVDHGTLLKEILTNNVIEVRAIMLRDLPPTSQCLVRTYNHLGTFRDERRVSGSADELCGVPFPDVGTIQVVWGSQPVTSSEAVVDSSLLQVPADEALLRKVTVSVRAQNRGENERQVQRNMVVFKR